MLRSELEVGNKLIASGTRPYLIAEVGSNFDQSIDKAKKLIDVAAESGADAVKFQLFSADKLYPKGGELHGIFKSVELNPDWVPKLNQHAHDSGLHFLASAFDLASVNILEAIDVPAHKIASSEVTNWRMLYKLAQTGKPLIISTGMSDMVDIEEAINICIGAGNNKIALMQCGSLYPLPINLTNLKVIESLRNRFNCPIGFSDHTLGQVAGITALGVGSVIFEKHFTLDKKSLGPDHFYALEPNELKAYFSSICEAYDSLGTGDKFLLQGECEVGRREGLYLARDMSQGEIISFEDIEIKRPAAGLRSRYAAFVIGAILNQAVKKGQPLSWDHLDFSD